MMKETVDLLLKIQRTRQQLFIVLGVFMLVFGIYGIVFEAGGAVAFMQSIIGVIPTQIFMGWTALSGFLMIVRRYHLSFHQFGFYTTPLLIYMLVTVSMVLLGRAPVLTGLWYGVTYAVLIVFTRGLSDAS